MEVILAGDKEYMGDMLEHKHESSWNILAHNLPR